MTPKCVFGILRFLLVVPLLLPANFCASAPMEKLKEKIVAEGKVAPFGAVLGVTDGGVEAYSCDYDSADPKEYPTMESYKMIHNGVFTGFKFQCVELARRYLLDNYGVVFDSIPMAYDIFHLKYVRRVADNELFVMTSHPNGSKEPPRKGSMLIWEPLGFFKRTGHVAIIVNVTNEFLDIVEQNVEDTVWPPGIKYSRRLPVKVIDGNYTIVPTYSDAKILGWMNISLDQLFTFQASL